MASAAMAEMLAGHWTERDYTHTHSAKSVHVTQLPHTSTTIIPDAELAGRKGLLIITPDGDGVFFTRRGKQSLVLQPGTFCIEQEEG